MRGEATQDQKRERIIAHRDKVEAWRKRNKEQEHLDKLFDMYFKRKQGKR